jgi:hypothetical protein
VRERRAKHVTHAGKPTPPADLPPAIGVQDDVHALVTEPGSLVEPALRRARQPDSRGCLEHASLRWCSTERELEEHRFTKAEAAEVAYLRRNAELEAAAAWRSRGNEQAAFGRVDMREEDAAIQRVEASASPPPAEQKKASDEKRRPECLVRGGRGEDERDADGRAEQRDASDVRARKSHAERRDEEVRRVSPDGHGTTRSRSWSRRLGPIPGTASSSSTELKAPCFAR